MNYLRLALDESFLSIGISRPNPAVGAVVVRDGVIVGKGRTQRPGNSHAEVMALRDAGNLARGAAIYVTLEPCCHYGRTPPCTKAIIEAGISQVFYAHADPNPVVRGNSRKILEEAGIEVFEGEEACMAASADTDDEDGKQVYHDVQRFFEGYDYFVRNHRTFVEIKSAVSQEGFMGAVSPEGVNRPIAITGPGANSWNHELRAMSDGILVGVGTLLSDNPSLNVRYCRGNDPVKIIWAGHRKLSLEELSRLKVFNQESTIVFSCVPQQDIKQEVFLLEGSTFRACWSQMLDHLSSCGMHRLMVEPGANLAGLLFADDTTENMAESGPLLWNRLDLWKSTDGRVDDRLAAQIAAGEIQKGLEFPSLPQRLLAKESFMTGEDVLTVYYQG